MYFNTFLPGLPKPVIRWLRNGQELTGNEPGVSILEDGTLLLLTSVSPLDNGEYVCAAANDAGSTERKYQLKVNGDLAVHLICLFDNKQTNSPSNGTELAPPQSPQISIAAKHQEMCQWS